MGSRLTGDIEAVTGDPDSFSLHDTLQPPVSIKDILYCRTNNGDNGNVYLLHTIYLDHISLPPNSSRPLIFQKKPKVQ